MVRNFLKLLGLLPYLKWLKETLFPSEGQRLEKSLAPMRLSFYQQFISKGDLCFDVGANIGNRTGIFLALGAKVIAVEPQKECAKLLKIRFGNKISLEKCALGKSEGKGAIYISETSEISSLSKDWISAVSKHRFKDKQWNQTEEVEISTLDKLISLHGVPKFCKIDVEGFEEEVLGGLSQPIPVISFEYTLPERIVNIKNCLDQLSRLGVFECNFTQGETMRLELGNWISKEELLIQMEQLSISSLFGDIYIRFNQLG
jgi:FkbM family methyltransferase